LLTKRHLAVIRAALRFFDEEMSPHGPDVSKHYFDEPLESDLTADEVRQLRELLRICELRYACCDRTGTSLIRQELLTTPEDVRNAMNISFGRIASVLLAPES